MNKPGPILRGSAITVDLSPGATPDEITSEASSADFSEVFGSPLVPFRYYPPTGFPRKLQTSGEIPGNYPGS